MFLLEVRYGTNFSFKNMKKEKKKNNNNTQIHKNINFSIKIIEILLKNNKMKIIQE